MNIEHRALLFAYEAHRGQVRKYTGEPYITHPISVADLVKTVPHNENMVAAALLHDVVEDTDRTIEDIRAFAGNQIADLVYQLTDVSTLADGNRAARKELDRQKLSVASPEAKTIKLADLIHNTTSITTFDPGFAVTYMAEKQLLLEVLSEGDNALWFRADRLVRQFFEQLGT